MKNNVSKTIEEKPLVIFWRVYAIDREICKNTRGHGVVLPVNILTERPLSWNDDIDESFRMNIMTGMVRNGFSRR